MRAGPTDALRKAAFSDELAHESVVVGDRGNRDGLLVHELAESVLREELHAFQDRARLDRGVHDLKPATAHIDIEAGAHESFTRWADTPHDLRNAIVASTPDVSSSPSAMAAITGFFQVAFH